MSFILKYRVIFITAFFAVLGLVLTLLLRLDELKWYYLVGTPVLALIISLLGYFFTDAVWTKKLKEKATVVTAVLGLCFFASLFFHLRVYNKGTFRYKDVKNITRTYIKGFEYTSIANQFKKDNANISSDADLLYEGFGGIDGKSYVWTEASIQKTRFQLIVSYSLTIFFLAALFSWILGVVYEKEFLDPVIAVKRILSTKNESHLEKYLRSYEAKEKQEKYKQLKFHVFISYGSTERKIAEELTYSLNNCGYMVFFDRQDLPPGMEYNTAIRTAIMKTDLFIFLISPTSLADGHYTVTELKFAAEKSPAASGFLLPVMAVATSFDAIPPYVKSVTVLTPKGNLIAEVTAEVEKLYEAKNAAKT